MAAAVAALPVRWLWEKSAHTGKRSDNDDRQRQQRKIDRRSKVPFLAE
jgi:hypothetical protein